MTVLDFMSVVIMCFCASELTDVKKNYFSIMLVSGS